MITIFIEPTENWDEKKEEFVSIKGGSLLLEHSLLSLSKWESKWKKPFLSKNHHSNEEMIDYIRCMTLTKDVDPNVYYNLSKQNLDDIRNYIDDSMTATTFSDDKSRSKSNEIITSEIIYYWMIALNIPFECQKWHLNRLLALIRVCNIKNNPGKKMSKREILSRNAALNAARRKQMNTRG